MEHKDNDEHAMSKGIPWQVADSWINDQQNIYYYTHSLHQSINTVDADFYLHTDTGRCKICLVGISEGTNVMCYSCNEIKCWYIHNFKNGKLDPVTEYKYAMHLIDTSLDNESLITDKIHRIKFVLGIY